MYHIHTTSAFVLSVYPSGEKNHFITLFTRDFGMIKAKAQSVRVIDSKLRYALQEYSYVEISLVKGKDVWRITNALPVSNIFFELKDKPEIFRVIARAILLLRRVVPEEGCEVLIFNDLEKVFNNSKMDFYTNQNRETIEWLLVLRMLCFLGYCQKESFADLCDEDMDWSCEYLNTVSPYKHKAVYSINEALKASHL